MLPAATWSWDRLLGKIRSACPGLPDVLSATRLHGGMIHHVFELSLAGEPSRAVLKVSEQPGDPFGREFRELDHLWSRRLLPCPRPWAAAPTDSDGPAYLLMERIPGSHWGAVAATPRENWDVERRLAELLLRLHSEVSGGFARFGDPPRTSWLDVFGPMLEENLRLAEPRLPAEQAALAARQMRKMASLWALGDPARPRLVHGDVWSGNVIVDRHEDGWTVSGLVDPALHFADEEYELAYLECFETVGEPFLAVYRAASPERDGYRVRRLFYWLNTMLVHVGLFGDEEYLVRTGRLLAALQRV